MNRIAIVTDSTSDIPEDLAEQNGIFVVPNILVIDGKSLEDGKDISRQEFYTNLPRMSSFPTTATASAGKYEQLYDTLLQQGYQHILSIHASSVLSGIFNAAQIAAQMFEDRVQVIDSQNISLGLGFQVLEAAEAALTGSLAHILERLADVRRRMHVVAMLDTLEYIRRSGRVSWARAHLGGLLAIKPFLEVRSGQIISIGETRTRHKGMQRLIDMLRGLGPLERLALLHTNSEADARQIEQNLAPELITPPLFVNITTVIGAHVGPNGLGYAAVVRW